MKAYIHLLSIFLFLGAVIYFGSKDVKIALSIVLGAFLGASSVMYAVKNKLLNF